MTALTLTVSASNREQREHVDLEERRSALLRFVRTRVQDAEVAEDLVQDVIYQFLRSIDASTAIEDATAWLFRAAKNRVIDWYRKPKHVAASSVENIETPTSRTSEDAPPLVDVQDHELWTAFLEALEELPEDQREVFILHELEGMPFNDIVEMTGVKLNTLLSRKRYAVLSLRRKLHLFR